MKDFPAFHRNKEPVLAVLCEVLPERPLEVLEIASGSGQHGPFFTETLGQVTWWPSDLEEDSMDSINGWREHLGADAVQAGQVIDVTSEHWRTGAALAHGPDQFDVVFSMNMIHIAPIAAMHGLVEGGGKRVKTGGLLMLYGPFYRHGVETASGNISFEQWLKGQNSQWGIRQLEEVTATADANGFDGPQIFEMPANNLTVVYTKR